MSGLDPKAVSWANRSAADYVGKYATSRANLVKVMTRRARRRYPEMEPSDAAELARRTAEFFERNLLVDDSVFAGSKARSGIRKGHSRRRIAQGLAAKGVEADTISEALSGTDDTVAAIHFARRRRIGPFRRTEADRAAAARESAAFARGGFSGDVVRAVMGMSCDEAEAVLFDGAPASPFG